MSNQERSQKGPYSIVSVVQHGRFLSTAAKAFINADDATEEAGEKFREAINQDELNKAKERKSETEEAKFDARDNLKSMIYEFEKRVNNIKPDITAEVLNELASYMDDCYLSFPQIIENPDLTEFKQQETEAEGFDCEYVKQGGGGIGGDSHAGTMAFPLKDNLFILIDYQM